ncbi:MAG: type II secretion system protein M [Betaproteobacteria bacterium]|nr:type II secretion system protein M [Betaproteobacteria bacterium]
MKEMWAKYAAKMDALSLRERIAVFAAALVVTVGIMVLVFIDPISAREKAVKARMTLQQTEMTALQSQVQSIEQRLANPDAANLVRRDNVRQQIAEIDERLKDMERSLVPAQRMNGLLQEMLARNPRLQLVGIRTLPVAPLVARSEKAVTPAAPAGAAAPTPTEKSSMGEGGVFKHGVEITVRGTYAEMHDYLVRLEKSPWRMFWSRTKVETQEYPYLVMTVTIYTLSLDKAWLQV